MNLLMNEKDLNDFLDRDFSQVKDDFVVHKVSDKKILVEFIVGERHLRPGGTVSGPTMFSLADVASYLVILAQIGPKALTVTTNSSMDFMRKPASGANLMCECEILKLGRRLAVVDSRIFSKGSNDIVARSTMTYSIPPKR